MRFTVQAFHRQDPADRSRYVVDYWRVVDGETGMRADGQVALPAPEVLTRLPPQDFLRVSLDIEETKRSRGFGRKSFGGLHPQPWCDRASLAPFVALLVTRSHVVRVECELRMITHS
jgi:hypothetical protein